MTLERCYGADIQARWEELGRLRVQVFRDYPYLYEGDLDYERAYLSTYWRSSDSLLLLVRDGGRAVGASTALPLAHESAELRAPFQKVDDIFYFGESVLLPGYRGRGIGRQFFAEREGHARRLGYVQAGFYAVERPSDHPRRPAAYRPLEDFWRGRGYAPHPEFSTTLSWRDLDEEEPSPKPMQFWLANL